MMFFTWLKKVLGSKGSRKVIKIMLAYVRFGCDHDTNLKLSVRFCLYYDYDRRSFLFIVKGKPLLMLQSVKRAYKVDGNHPLVHEAVVRYSKKMLQWESEGNLPISVSKVIAIQMEPILKGRTAFQINDEYLKKNYNSLPARLQAARVMYMLDNSKQREAIDLATNLESSLEGISIQNCIDVINSLKDGSFGNCDNELNEYKLKCHEKYPLAVDFFPPGAAKSPSIKLLLDRNETTTDHCIENSNSN